MNIKKIIKSQKIRHQLMRLGSFLPDHLMISLQYKLLLGRWPNLKSPQRFTEWIQWYKANYRDSKMLCCVDKYEVRNYVKSKNCEKYLNELYQLCNKGEEINFETLPQKFVIKTTSGGAGDNVLIIKDKSTISYSNIVKKINSWLEKNYSDTSREWAYSKAANNPRIIVERYLENTPTSFSSNQDSSPELLDYKFYCFNGQPYVCQLISGRYTEEHIDFYDLDWNRLDGVVGLNQKAKNSPYFHQKPKNLDEMIEVTKKLSKDFPYVRVDLYNINGRIYFGELTFYPGSGYGSFVPDSFDYELGNLFSIKPNSKYEKNIKKQHYIHSNQNCSKNP